MSINPKRMWRIKFYNAEIFFEPRPKRITFFDSRHNVWCDMFPEENFGIIEDYNPPPNCEIRNGNRYKNEAVMTVRRQHAVLNAIHMLNMVRTDDIELQTQIRYIKDNLYKLLSL